MMVGGILKFITKIHKVCSDSMGKDVYFGSSITRITKHYIRPATRVKELLAVHSDDDSIWNNTDPCDVSLDDTSDTKIPVIVKPAMVVGNCLITFAQARSLGMMNGTVNLEDTIVDTPS